VNPQVQLESSKVMDRVKDVALMPAIPELTLRSFESDAKRLMSNDAAGASQILGAVHSMRFDAKEIHHWFGNAIKYKPNDANIYRNYAVALSHVYMPSDAFDVLLKGHQLEPENLTIFGELVQYAAQGGRFSESVRFADLYNKASCKDKIPDLHVVSGFLKENNFDEKCFAACFNAAHDYLAMNRIRHGGYSVRYISSPEFPRVRYEIMVHLDDESYLSHDMGLSNYLSDHLEVTNEYCHLVIRITPFQDET